MITTINIGNDIVKEIYVIISSKETTAKCRYKHLNTWLFTLTHRMYIFFKRLKHYTILQNKDLHIFYFRKYTWLTHNVFIFFIHIQDNWNMNMLRVNGNE